MTTDLARQDAAPTDLAVADREQAAGALAHILATGDLSKLSDDQRVAFYLTQCKTLDLNPYSRPFDWLILDNKLILYPNKSCGEQLRRLHQISVKVTRREIVGDLFVCEVEGRTPTGRTDEASKYVPLTYWNQREGKTARLTGTNLANAFAKAETGAKRRLVLSMVGLASPPDPDEVKSARFVTVDGTGRILDNPTQEQLALAADPVMARTIGEPVFEDADGSGAPFSGMPDQRPTTEELTPPERPSGPPPSFKNGAEQINRWLGAWFAAVKGLSLDTEDARHRFVAAWTADEWPKAKRTESLRTAFARMTTAEAGEFLAHVRAQMEGERRELLDQADEPQERGRSGDDVHDAFVLTGASDDVETATAL